MDNNSDQYRFYTEDDLRAVSGNGFRWGMFAGIGSTILLLSGLLLMGYLSGY